MVRPSFLIIGIPAILMLLSSLGCDSDQESPDNATITGRVFADSSMTQGVQGVQVVVESDQTSQIPYSGPDQFANTNQNGLFSVSFFLGFTADSSGAVTHMYMADCKVSYWFQGRTYAWTTGVTVASGKDYALPDVSLDQFQ